MSEQTRIRIQSLEERLVRIRQEKDRLLAQASLHDRKCDTRRKILIGGAVLAAADHEGVPALQSRGDLIKWLDTQLTRPHDRALFSLPEPKSAMNHAR